LELPDAPDAELPDMVRFQAAAKSATPLDQLVLDFVPLPRMADEQGRPTLMATIDRQQFDGLKRFCSAAGLELKSIQASPFSIAEVAVRFEQQRGDDPNAATLVIFQDQHRVELAILRQLGLLFSHQTRVSRQDERSVRGTMAEINRSIITLGQSMHTSLEVARVCLIHDGDVDPALEQALSERFAGRLEVIDPAGDQAIDIQPTAVPAMLAGLAPAVGTLLGELGRTIPAVDFLNPRKPPKAVDPRKQRMIKWGGIGAAALLLLGGGLWMYHGRLSGRIAALKSQQQALDQTIKEGEPTVVTYDAINRWRLNSARPLPEIDRFNQLLPGTERMVMLDLHVAPGKNGGVAQITGSGIARSESDIRKLFDSLVEEGYLVTTPTTTPYKPDPDYPYRFLLDAIRMPEEAPEPPPAAG
jgi:hypothetical protein